MVSATLEELAGLAVFAVALVGFVYGALLYLRGLTGFWPSVFLIGGGALGLVFAGYLLVLFHVRQIVEG